MDASFRRWIPRDPRIALYHGSSALIVVMCAVGAIAFGSVLSYMLPRIVRLLPSLLHPPTLKAEVFMLLAVAVSVALVCGFIATVVIGIGVVLLLRRVPLTERAGLPS